MAEQPLVILANDRGVLSFPSCLGKARPQRHALAIVGGTAFLVSLLVGLFVVVSTSRDLAQHQLMGGYERSFLFSESIPIGEPVRTTACDRAVSPGLCIAVWQGMTTESLGAPSSKGFGVPQSFWEAGWDDGNRLGFTIIEGRWPERPGEVVAGNGLGEVTEIVAWGGRVRLNVVGRVRREGWRESRDLLIAPGTFTGLPARGMEFSGVSTGIKVLQVRSSNEELAEAATALGLAVPHDPRVLSRHEVERGPFSSTGMLAMMIPSILLTAAGGLVSGLVVSRWRRRLEYALGRQGVDRAIVRGWVRRAHLRGLLVIVPAALLAGWAGAWLVRPALSAYLGQPVSRPETHLVLAAIPFVLVLSSLAGTGGRQVGSPDSSGGASPTGKWSGGAALALVLTAIWIGPLSPLPQEVNHMVEGALLSAAAALLASHIMRGVSALPTSRVSRTLSQRLLQRNASQHRVRVALVTLVLALTNVVVFSLGASTEQMNHELHSTAATPRRTVVMRMDDQQLAARVPEVVSRAGVVSTPLWFAAHDSEGQQVLVVESPAGASVVLGRQLREAEARALAQGAMLTPQDTTDKALILEDGHQVRVRALPVTDVDPYLSGRAGLMLASRFTAAGGPLGTATYALLGSSDVDVEKVAAAATDLAIGREFYTVPYSPPDYRGSLWDRAQPWLLGAFAFAVMGSMINSLATQLRPIRSSMLTLGLPRRLSWGPLWWNTVVLCVVMIKLSVLPVLIPGLLDGARGAQVWVPWILVGRAAGTILVASLLGGVTGLIRVQLKERLSQ